MATVIIAAVTIAIVISSSFWMGGLVSVFTRFEKIEVKNAYVTNSGGNYVVNIEYVNTGSSPTSIDSVLLNGVPYSSYMPHATLSGDFRTLPSICETGVSKSGAITLQEGAEDPSGNQLKAGVTLTITLYTTGGKDYITSTTLQGGQYVDSTAQEGSNAAFGLDDSRNKATEGNYGSVTTPSIDQFVASDITHDEVLGCYTVQNDKIKVVFHYKPNEAERWDAGGGNIYELCDLEVDPIGNLAHDAFGESGGTGPEAPGVGGLGCTKIWYEKAGERRICADNNLAGGQRIERQSVGVVNGNVVYEVSLIMKDYTYQTDLYRVDKKWTVFPDGRIMYELKWTILQNLLMNSPSINFAVNPNYVDDFKVFRGGAWVQTDYRTEESWAGLPHAVGGRDYNTGSYISEGKEAYAQKYVWLRNGVPRLIIRWNTTFEESGLFQLAQSFGPPPQYTPHGELSNYIESATEPFGISCRWFGWAEYPSNPYHLVEKAKSWTDTIWLELT